MSRLAKTIKNAKVGLFFHFLFVTSQFVSRKIFLDGLGDTFIGTVSTLQSFLGFLNLAELGIGTAIGFTLYKPIFNKNYTEINQIIRFFGNIYKKIGYFILGGAFLLSAFFPWIFKDVGLDLWLIYLTFFGLLTPSLLGYFFNYHVFLLEADQKDYIVAKYYQSFNITKILIQAVFVFYLQSYVVWIGLEILSGMLYTILIRKKIKKEYPWLLLSGKLSKSDRQFDSYKILVKKIKQIGIHKVGEFFAIGLDNIIIFFFLSAQIVAYFANYQMVLVNLGTLVEKIFAGSKASVGNLVAENNPHSIKQVFWEFMVIRFFIAGFGFNCIYYLINPFINLWLGNKYVLSESTTIMFAIIFFLRQIVQPTEVFKQAYGLYDDVWAPIVKSVLNLVISIILVRLYGITGLLIGTFSSVMVIEGIWRPYYVYKRGFQRSHREYIFGYLKLTATFAMTFFFLNYIYKLNDFQTPNFFDWALKTLWISMTTLVVYGIILYTSNHYSRDVLNRLKNQFFNK